MSAPNAPRRRPAGQKSTEKPYHWFKGHSVRTLFDRLAAYGPDTARLEVRVEGEKMTFRVVREWASAEAAAEPDINDSFLCPPRCQ